MENVQGHFLFVCETSSRPSSIIIDTLSSCNMPQSNSSTDYDIIQQQLMAIRTKHCTTTNPLLASILARPCGQRLDQTDLVHILSTALILSNECETTGTQRMDPGAQHAALALASQLDNASSTSHTDDR
jgi:hypothetical protein